MTKYFYDGLGQMVRTQQPNPVAAGRDPIEKVADDPSVHSDWTINFGFTGFVVALANCVTALLRSNGGHSWDSDSRMYRIQDAFVIDTGEVGHALLSHPS